MKKTRLIAASALTLASLGAVQPARAQGFFQPTAPEKGVTVEVSHPNFKESELTLPSTVWIVGGQLPLNERFRAFVDIPFAYAKFDGELFGGESSTVLGNPLVGLAYVASRSLLFEVSARAPLTSADETSFADVVGMISDPQRVEAFAKDVVPVAGALVLERAVAPNLSLRARGGATGIFYTGDEEDDDADLLADYGLFSSYTAGAARVGLGVSGRWMVSADEGSFSENSVHQAGATLDALIGGVRPGVSVRVPLDKEQRDIVGSSVGVYLQVPLR